MCLFVASQLDAQTNHVDAACTKSDNILGGEFGRILLATKTHKMHKKGGSNTGSVNREIPIAELAKSFEYTKSGS